MTNFDPGRRDFLKLGLGGAAALGLGSSLAVLSGCSSNSGPAPGYRYLRPQDLELLRALSPALLAGALPAGTDPEMPLRRLDELLSGNSPAGRKLYLQLLDMLQLGAVRWYFSGRWTAFSEQSEEELRETLATWAASDNGLARLALRGVALSGMMAWYTQPDVAATTGYPGPPRKIV